MIEVGGSLDKLKGKQLSVSPHLLACWVFKHAIKWSETTIIDQDRRTKELKIKEALHNLTTPSDRCLNRDDGLKLLGCWMATMKQVGGGAGSTQTLTSRTFVSFYDSDGYE